MIEVGSVMKVMGCMKLQDEGHPEKLMFHYGRMKASSSKIVKIFLATFGTGTTAR